MRALVVSITETLDAYSVVLDTYGSTEPGTISVNVDYQTFKKLFKQGIEGNNEVEVSLTVLDPLDC